MIGGKYTSPSDVKDISFWNVMAKFSTCLLNITYYRLIILFHLTWSKLFFEKVNYNILKYDSIIPVSPGFPLNCFRGMHHSTFPYCLKPHFYINKLYKELFRLRILSIFLSSFNTEDSMTMLKLPYLINRNGALQSSSKSRNIYYQQWTVTG